MWTSSPASAALRWLLRTSGKTTTSQNYSATSTLTAKPCSPSTGLASQSTATSSISPQKSIGDVFLPTPTTANGIAGGTGQRIKLQSMLNHASTWSPEDSPASLFPRPDSVEARTTIAFFGLRCIASYGSSIPAGSSLKTFVDCLVRNGDWYSSKCALTWRGSHTTFRRLLFQLQVSALPTAETVSGLLQTPEARNHSGYQTSGGEIRPRLSMQIAMLPTPQARDWKEPENPRPHGFGQLTVPLIVSGEKVGLKLQPAFVEWIMGYPEGWTELPGSKLSEMRSSRKSRSR